ncbi:MAG: IclR family transcriptional regulator [Candidatus Dormibacteraceae bacterium]
MTIVRLAQVALNGLDLGRMAEPYVERIAAATGETSHCAVWSQDCAIIIRHMPGTYPIRAPGAVGERMPAHCTSLGKVLLAFQPKDVIEAVLQGTLERYTLETISDPVRLQDELEQVRAHEVAFNYGEYRDDAVGVAAPVWDHEGRLAAALSVSGPAYRLTDDRIKELAKEVVRPAAWELSEMLGSPVRRLS